MYEANLTFMCFSLSLVPALSVYERTPFGGAFFSIQLWGKFRLGTASASRGRTLAGVLSGRTLTGGSGGRGIKARFLHTLRRRSQARAQFLIRL